MLLNEYSRYNNIILRSIFFPRESYLWNKKFQRGNQLVRKEKLIKTGRRIFLKNTLAEMITAEKDRKKEKASKVSNGYEVIILCKK